jgi:serine/threonine-protein kinase RIO1
MMIKLFCAVVGDGSVFPVDIDASETVGDLKDAVKEKQGYDFAASKLTLYLAKKEDGAWLIDDDNLETLLQMDVNDVCRQYMKMKAARRIRSFNFPDEDSREDHEIHVLVKLPEELVQLTPKKRKLDDLKEHITPSSFAKCSGPRGWISVLEDYKDQVQCHRFEDSYRANELIPIVLLNETFARFDNNCQTIEIRQKDCNFVVELCQSLAIPYTGEDQFAQVARDVLQRYLFEDDTFRTATPMKSKTDGSYVRGNQLLMNLECKLQNGGGGGDPTMQNVGYYIKNLPSSIDRQLPCFLVDLCGPLLSVSGIVNVGDEMTICEPLVESFPLIYFDNEPLLTRLARVCLSLKVALEDLRDMHNRQSAGVSATDLAKSTFPYKDTATINDKLVTLQYVHQLQRKVFVAKMEGGREVIVKLSKRYGKEVHEYCASEGFAPKLLACERLVNGWIFIVMEKLNRLIHVTKADQEFRPQIRKSLRAIQDSLKDAKFVHGDLRDGNVWWDAQARRVVLIDFDWSGTEGEMMYPPFMNKEIPWAEGAEYGKPLRAEHDVHWIDKSLADLH